MTKRVVLSSGSAKAGVLPKGFLADTSWLLHGYKRYKGETLVPCHSTPSTLDGFALTSNEIWFCQTRALCSLEERHLGYDLSTLSSQNTLEWEQDLRDVHDVPNQGSEEERPVRVVGGQPAPIPLKPHEIESAMCEQFFTNVMKSFEDELAPKPLVPSLPPTAKAPGRPQTARIKPGDAAKKMAKGKKAEYRLKQPVVKPRHNGKRIRGPTHCRRCGKPGHNASTREDGSRDGAENTFTGSP